MFFLFGVVPLIGNVMPQPQAMKDQLARTKLPPLWDSHPVAVKAHETGAFAVPIAVYVDAARFGGGAATAGRTAARNPHTRL